MYPVCPFQSPESTNTSQKEVENINLDAWESAKQLSKTQRGRRNIKFQSSELVKVPKTSRKKKVTCV